MYPVAQPPETLHDSLLLEQNGSLALADVLFPLGEPLFVLATSVLPCVSRGCFQPLIRLGKSSLELGGVDPQQLQLLLVLLQLEVSLFNLSQSKFQTLCLPQESSDLFHRLLLTFLLDFLDSVLYAETGSFSLCNRGSVRKTGCPVNRKPFERGIPLRFVR